MPGGQPSITQPIAGPCDSPKLVTRKMWPKVDDMAPDCAPRQPPATAYRPRLIAGCRATAARVASAIQAWPALPAPVRLRQAGAANGSRAASAHRLEAKTLDRHSA